MRPLAVLQAGREAAERLMRTTVRITRPTGDVSFDGLTPVKEHLVLYEGIAKLQSYEGYEQERTSVDANITSVRVRLDLPVGVVQVEPGDRAEVLDSADDPAMVGRSLRVAGLAPYKSMATAYRVYADLIERG